MCHSWHRGIHRGFHLEERGVIVLWSAWLSGSVDRRVGRRSGIRIGPAGFGTMCGVGFVGLNSFQKATVLVVFVEIETCLILRVSVRYGQVFMGYRTRGIAARHYPSWSLVNRPHHTTRERSDWGEAALREWLTYTGVLADSISVAVIRLDR